MITVSELMNYLKSCPEDARILLYNSKLKEYVDADGLSTVAVSVEEKDIIDPDGFCYQKNVYRRFPAYDYEIADAIVIE